MTISRYYLLHHLHRKFHLRASFHSPDTNEIEKIANDSPTTKQSLCDVPFLSCRILERNRRQSLESGSLDTEYPIVLRSRQQNFHCDALNPYRDPEDVKTTKRELTAFRSFGSLWSFNTNSQSPSGSLFPIRGYFAKRQSPTTFWFWVILRTALDHSCFISVVHPVLEIKLY